MPVPEDVVSRIDAAIAGARERVRTIGDGLVVVADVESEGWGEVPRADRTLCFGRIVTGDRRGELCDREAGAGTSHAGVGLCSRHGGNTEEGAREGAWLMAHAFARQLNVTPWEGLELAVRIAAGRVAFIEHKLAQAEVDRQLEPPSKDSISEAGRVQDQQGTNLYHWVKQAELWHDKLTRVSALAIQQGVSEKMVRQLELEAQLMLRATSRTLEELGFTDDDLERALGLMSRNLLAVEAEEAGHSRVIESS